MTIVNQQKRKAAGLRDVDGLVFCKASLSKGQERQAKAQLYGDDR